ATALAPIAHSLSQFKRDLVCRIVTDSLMTLALPSTTLALGWHLDRPPAPSLATISDPDARYLLARFEPESGTCNDCGAKDWSDITQRMHYIVHLFWAFQ